MSLNLAFISSEYLPKTNAEATWTHQYCTQLSKRGMKVDLITTANVPIHLKKSATFVISDIIDGWTYSEVIELAKIIKIGQYDGVIILYVAHMYNEKPWISLLPKWIRRDSKVAAIFAGPQAIPHFKNDRTFTKNPLLNIYFSHVFNESNKYGALLTSHGLMTLCEDHKQIITNNDPSLNEKTVVLPPPAFFGVPNSEEQESFRSFRSELKINKDTTLLVYLGNFYRGKGVEDLIQAISLIKEKTQNFKLLMIGGDTGYASLNKASQNYMKEMKDLVLKLQLQDYVSWTGYVEDELLVSKYLCSSDIAILPFSNGLSMNNSSFAFLASHGLAVISTHSQKTDGILTEDESVVFTKPNDANDLAEKILYLIKDRVALDRYAKASKEFYQKHYDWDKVLDWTINVLK